MIWRILCSGLLIVFTVTASSALRAASTPTPTPTPKPKRSFFSIKPTVNPSATPSKSGVALARGAHVGADRPSPSATPQSTPRAKAKPSASTAHKSPAPATKAAKSPAPTATPSAKKEKSPTPQPSTTASAPAQTPAPAATASAPESVSPPPSTKLELTLTKFEPQHGSPGDADYRSARLSYRLNVPSKMEFPVINFSVDSASGKIFARRFALPKGSAFIEPGDTTERTVALDPAPRDDWADAYGKIDNAKFSWSIEGLTSGEIEKPVKKSWP